MGIPLWLLSLIIGVVIAFIVVSVMKSQLKSVRRQPGATSYLTPEGVNLTVRQDIYLYERTTQHMRQQEDNND